MNILITGGASGLGESITKRLAQDKNNSIYFTYSRSAENAQKINKEFSNTIAIKCDFTNAAEVNALKDKIASLNLDVLINNAYGGSFIKTHFHKLAADDFLNEFRDNLIPTITLTQAAINSFRKKKSGKIITILSAILLNKPNIGSAIYAANKAYLSQLTKVWATENTNFNITSNSVSPEFMLTSFTSDMDERLLEQIKENHPLKKLLTTEEVAETVAYLVNASSQVNGIDILMNSASNLR